MTVASFRIPGQGGSGAEVSIMPMPGEGAGNLGTLVNIVRQGAGMKPMSDEELTKLVQEVRIGDGAARLVDLSGATATNASAQADQIILAVYPRAGTTWFFKMAGSSALVASQKSVFLEFLKSIKFNDSGTQTVEATGSAAGAAASESSRSSRAKPQWEVPANWQEVSPSQMLLAKFLLAGQGDGKAEVTVSVFPGDVGGVPANVNRWRRQIGLPEVKEAELGTVVRSLDVMGGKAMLVDMSGQDPRGGRKARLIGVILPQSSQTWFYKLLGDDAVAGQEKAAFIKFVQSAKPPNAP